MVTVVSWKYQGNTKSILKQQGLQKYGHNRTGCKADTCTTRYAQWHFSTYLPCHQDQSSVDNAAVHIVPLEP